MDNPQLVGAVALLIGSVTALVVAMTRLVRNGRHPAPDAPPPDDAPVTARDLRDLEERINDRADERTRRAEQRVKDRVEEVAERDGGRDSLPDREGPPIRRLPTGGGGKRA